MKHNKNPPQVCFLNATPTKNIEMKQFLRIDQFCQGLVVALNDRSFFVSINEGDTYNNFIELLPPPLTNNEESKNQRDDDDDDDDNDDDVDGKKVVNSETIKNDTVSENDRKDSETHGTSESVAIEPTHNVPDGQTEPNNDDHKQNSIEAVAIFSRQVADTNDSDDIEIWCAVSRYDKSLSIYLITKKDVVQQHCDMKHHKILPIIVHRTSKRSGSLCFATVPPPRDEGLLKSNPLPVVITGDLAGDCYAFSINRSEDHDKKESNENEHKVSSHTKRLLLGHTASMLTSVHVVPIESCEVTNNGMMKIIPQQRIITSDRDEKIRISSFPATHQILGFLLGHESFISCIDYSVLSNRCISISGDKTIRLWDYMNFKELAQVLWDDESENNNNNANTLNDNEIENTDTRVSEPQEITDEHIDTIQNEKSILEPSRIALNSLGDVAVSIYENCLRLDLWKVHHANDTNDDETLRITKCLELNIKSQPLAVTFYGKDTLFVLSREPEYLNMYKISHDVKSDNLTILDVTVSCSSCKQLQIFATEEDIIMPENVIERDIGNQKSKLQKANENRGGARTQPWNNLSRIETAKERNRRMKKRQRER